MFDICAHQSSMTAINLDDQGIGSAFQVAEVQNNRILSEFSEKPLVIRLLKKWDLYGKLQFNTFSYQKCYHKLQGHELVQDLFNDATFQKHFKVATKSGDWEQLQGSVTNMKLQTVPASETRLDLFDRLMAADPPIVRSTARGDIIKCMDYVVDGIQVSDELRRFLVCADSDCEHAELYSNEERQVLLWRLFELLCIGGACCQFEDQLHPYLEVTKMLYKALLSVQKSAGTGKVEVISQVYEVLSCTPESGMPLFPVSARTNLCLVVVTPLTRLVKVLYHAHVPYW